MPTSIPQWPAKLTRDQTRYQKEREKAFFSALKLASKAAGWGYAAQSLFRQEDDWFVNVLPRLLWERGAYVMSFAKPMGVDPIFWEIAGMPENARMPLSFRSNGAFVLWSPFSQDHFSLDVQDPERLANDVVVWASGRLAAISSKEPNSLLSEVKGQKNFAALEVCLRILLNDWHGAAALCEGRSQSDWGGFGFGRQTFFDRARDWIASERP